MVNLAKRMKRNKVDFSHAKLPIGTHLLLSGLLLTIKGVTYDIGLPGWLVENVPQTRQRDFNDRIEGRRREYRTAKPSRGKILERDWWHASERKADSKGALSRLLGEEIATTITATAGTSKGEKTKSKGGRRKIGKRKAGQRRSVRRRK
jgi:hypothetical protein